MAKKAQPEKSSYASISKKTKTDKDQVFEREFVSPVNKGKWSTKEEMDITCKTLSRLETDMMPYRRNSCVWRANKNIEDEWKTNWDQYLMVTNPQDQDDYLPDAAPHLTFKNVEVIMSEFIEHRLRNKTKPQRSRDIPKTRVYDVLLDNIADQYDFDTIDQYTALYFFITGMGYQGSIWSMIKSQGSVPKVTSKMTKDEKLKFETEMKLMYEKKGMIVHDDIDHIFIPNEEMFVAAEGTRLQGRVNVIPDFIRSRMIGYDDAINMFKFDPDVDKKKLDCIKPLGDLKSSSFYDGLKPSENTYSNSVNLIMHEDLPNDQVVYLINDTFIKATPNKSDCKKHSVVDFHYLDLPQYHYTPGMASMLYGTEQETSILRNLSYTQMHLDIEKVTYVDDSISADVENGALRREPGLIVPIPNLAEIGADRAIKEMSGGNPILQQAQVFIKDLDDIASDITGISKQRFGTVQKSSDSATEVQTREASTLKLMMKAIKNFAKGKRYIGRLDIAWIKQNYKNPVLDDKGEILNESEIKDKKKLEAKKDEYRKIMLENIKIVPTYEQQEGKEVLKTIDIVEEKGWHEFEIKGDYLDTERDLVPYVDPESIKNLTKPLQIQLVQNSLAQYSAFAGYKGQPLPNGQMPILDITKMVISSIKLQDLPDDWILDNETTEEEDIMNAQSHLNRILEGVFVIGLPGASDEHVDFELDVAVDMADYVEYLHSMVEKEPLPELKLDPMTGMPMPPKLSKYAQELAEKQHILELLNRHIQGHRVPAGVDPNLQDSITKGQVQPGIDPNSIPMPSVGAPPAQEGMQIPQSNMGSDMNKML